jgi:hypothetical protein
LLWHARHHRLHELALLLLELGLEASLLRLHMLRLLLTREACVLGLHGGVLLLQTLLCNIIQALPRRSDLALNEACHLGLKTRSRVGAGLS